MHQGASLQSEGPIFSKRNRKEEPEMKKMMQTMASLILAMAMIFAPAMDAQTRGRQGSVTPAG